MLLWIHYIHNMRLKLIPRLIYEGLSKSPSWFVLVVQNVRFENKKVSAIFVNRAYMGGYGFYKQLQWDFFLKSL